MLLELIMATRYDPCTKDNPNPHGMYHEVTPIKQILVHYNDEIRVTYKCVNCGIESTLSIAYKN